MHDSVQNCNCHSAAVYLLSVGQCYRHVLLPSELLRATRIIGDVFVFQQDNAPPAHRARDTVELLCCKKPQFISPDMWPANTVT